MFICLYLNIILILKKKMVKNFIIYHDNSISFLALYEYFFSKNKKKYSKVFFANHRHIYTMTREI